MANDRIFIDSDIRRANGLPPRIYVDSEWFDRMRDFVFGRTWQCVGSTQEFEKKGSVRPLTLLPQCLDEPIALVRSDAGLRCLSNVCTHRGHAVVEAEGCQEALQCRYHGRRFNLDGRMTGMPEFQGVERFPGPTDDLPAVPLERLGPVAFVALDPAAPFVKWTKPLTDRVGFLGLDRLVHDAATDKTFEFDANWALYVDNYLEGFHIPYIHRELLAKLDWSRYQTLTFEYCSVQIAEAAEGEAAFELPSSHPDAGKRIAAFYFWFFPGTMLNFYPWGLSLNILEPLGPARTRVRFQSFVGKPELRGQGAGSGLDRVEAEDEAAVTVVQRGMRSRFAVRARYSPTQEIGTHHFHRLLAQFVNSRT